MAASLRRQALRIFQAALKAADPYAAVLRHLELAPKPYRNIFVIGAGKASAQMARAVERKLGARVSAGLINVKDGHGAKLRRIQIQECRHPVPDQRGVAGAKRIAQIAGAAGPDDLVICLISGGASALLPLPAPGITLGQKQKITRSLLACGASIHEINCVRKHISRIKGGQLARLAYPAKLLTLILSDVVGDNLDVIGSGPTVPDRSTVADAQAILDKYRVPDKLRLEETPKPGDRVFARTRNVIVGSNALAVDAAAREAKRLGFRTLVLSTSLEGEAREVARVHAAIANEICFHARPVAPPACVISGGETTVTIRGKGLGGRNQEFALAAAIGIANNRQDVVILSAGTDGTDGPTDATGAIVDNRTLDRARQLGLDASAFLMNNDAYHFFEATGDLIKTGPTGTNVADIQVILVR